MKDKLYCWLLCITLLMAFGCQKGPYPYISLKDVKSIDSAVHPAIKNVAFIYQLDVYYAKDFDQPVTRITTDASASKWVKMSHDHTKFAYLDFTDRIMIVDSKGALIKELPQYNKVKSFDWSPDDKTLYILNNDAMAYYGPSMNLPDFEHPGILNGSTIEVLSASVSMKGDFAYVVHGFSFLYGDKYELVIHPKAGGSIIEYDNAEDDFYTMDYVNFSTNKQDLVVGYKELHSGSDSQRKLNFFTDLQKFPSSTFGGYSSTGACTPAYNSSINYVVGGFIHTDNKSFIAPAAIYLGPGSVFSEANLAQSKYLDKYSFAGNDLYTDWK